MSRGNDFARISDLFSLRLSFDESSVDPNCIKYLNQIRKYDKNQFSNLAKCKNWIEVYNCLDKIKFNYQFDQNIIDEILNISISFQEANVLIFFFQILSFLYAHSQQNNTFNDDGYVKIVAGLIFFNPYRVQAKHIYADIYSFFANSIIFFYNLYHQMSSNLQAISSEIIKFYTTSPFLINVDIFSDFIIIASIASQKYEDLLLNLVLSNAQTRQLPEKIILFLQPLCEKFNEKAMSCLSLLYPYNKIEQIVKDLATQICQNAGETHIDINEEEQTEQILQDGISKFKFEIIETKSKFALGFKSYIEDCDNESEFLIRILNKNVRKKINAFENAFQFFQQNFVQSFLQTIVENFNNSTNNDQKFSLFIIFIILCDKISKNSVISVFSNFFFNSLVFNQKVTVFNNKKLDPILETIRSLVFSIVDSSGCIKINETIHSIKNPLFLAEFLSRIKNVKNYYDQHFVETVINTSLVLRKIDIERHTEIIEKARSSLFLVLSNIFIDMEKSDLYFSQIMQFCYEKSTTSIFVFLFKKSLMKMQSCYDFEPVFNFINCSMKYNLEISWRFIEIISKFFLHFKQCPELTYNIFDILINYLHINHENNSDLHTYEALQFVFQFVAHYQKVSSFQLSVISQFIRKFDSEELRKQIVSYVGVAQTKMLGKEGFLIQHPIYILIIALTFGFTEKVLRLFNELINFSLLNTSYFHRFKIDYILVQLLTSENGSKFKNEGVDFDIQIGDEKKMKELLFRIMKVNSDYSIVSSFLTNKSLLPHLCRLVENSLNDPRPVIPYGFFKPNYICNKLHSSHFQKNFTLSFWLLIDTFVEVHDFEVNLFTFECNTAKLRIFIQKSQIKIRLDTRTNMAEVVLRTNITDFMNWRHFTLIFEADTYLISTLIDNDELNQSQFVPLSFPNNTDVITYIGGSLSNTFNHHICGYIGTITLYNRLLSDEEIEHITYFKKSATKFDANSVIISSARPYDFEYKKRSYTNETLLSTLRNSNTVNKIFQLLFKEEDEETCYNYLSLIDSMAFFTQIDYLPVYHFITQEKRFQYKKLYKVIFSIFSHLSLRRKNDENEKESISNSSSNDGGLKNNLNLNLSMIRNRNPKQELSLQQKWFKYIIINLDVWINYCNFDEILFFWNDTLLARYHFLFREMSNVSAFLKKIEIFEEKRFSAYHWDQFFIFLKRLAYINMTQEEERMLFSMISELLLKFNKLMTTDAYMKNTLQYCTAVNEIKRVYITQSNLEDLCREYYGYDENDEFYPERSKKINWPHNQIKEKIKKHFHQRKHKKKKLSDIISQSESLTSINESMSLDQGLNADFSSSSNEEESGTSDEAIIEEEEEDINSENTSNSNTDNNNNNDNNNNDNNNNDNDNDNENNNDDDNYQEEGKKEKKSKFLKLNFFSKLHHKKRKSLEYEKKYFQSLEIGFSSESELEKTSNTLIHLLQLTHFTSYAKNNRSNNQSNIDDDNDDNYNDNNINSGSTTNSPREQRPDLVRQLFSALQKERMQFNVIFSALRIKDSSIITEALIGIHEIIPHSSVLKYTTEALRIIDPRMYEGVIQNLCKQIHLYPYLFPLLCALLIFSKKTNEGKEKKKKSSKNSIFNDSEFISNLDEVVINDYFEKWIFFPVILSFFIQEKFAKEQILAVIARSATGNWNAILTSITLITYIQDFFALSNHDSLLIFYMLLTNFNPDNKNLGDLFVQVCYSLFFVASPSKPKYVPFQFSNVDDALNFVNQSYSSIDVHFFVRLEDGAIFNKGLNDLALNLLSSATTHFREYTQDYIRNVQVILGTISLDCNPNNVEACISLGNFIEKMQKEYKEEYTKQIHSILETVKKGLSSKSFHEFTNEKFLMSIANSKSSSFSTSDDNLNQDNQQSPSAINMDSNDLHVDPFARLGLKQKRSVDRMYRQGILEEIKTSTPTMKIDLKEGSVNCRVYKEEGEEGVPASFELKKGVITIKTDSKCDKIDRNDIFGFKRENQTIEFVTNEGKIFYIDFNDTESNKMLRTKLTKKKVASREQISQLFYQKVEKWKEYKITNFQLLMYINFYKGRTPKSSLKPCFPSMLSNDVHKNSIDESLYDFSNNIKLDDISFDVDFAGETNENHTMIDQLKTKNVVSAELYYFFESISPTEPIPKDFASDRFEFVYKLRKMLEKTQNLYVWVDKVFHEQIPPRPSFVNSLSEVSATETKVKFAAQINDVDCNTKFILCSTEGQLIIITKSEIKEATNQFIEFSADAKFFALSDGILIYSNKLHNLVTVDKEGNTKIIENIFIDPTIARFSGSINRLVYLSTPTRINLVRDLTFWGSLTHKSSKEKRKILPSSKGKPAANRLDVDGNQIIHQIQSCVKILEVSLNFSIIATFSEDTCVRLLTLYDGKSINEFNLKGKVALKILITNAFGFVFIATKFKAYLLTNNGTLIKKVHFNFQNVIHWFTFTDVNGIDFIGMVKNDGEKNTVLFFEAFYLDKINEEIVCFNGISNFLSILYDTLSEEFTLLDRDGRIALIPNPLSAHP